jgi:hypothetical protein
MRFRDVYRTDTFAKYDGQIIEIDNELYDIDMFPLVPEDNTSRLWIRARRTSDDALFSSVPDMCGFHYDNPKVEKVLNYIRWQVANDLEHMGLMYPVAVF